MATIHICDRCGKRPPSSWYGLNVFTLNEDGRKQSSATYLDLCYSCYQETVKDFDFIKRNTPDVEVKVVS